MAQMTPYLHFNGSCNEAMKFYQASLGGELDIQKVGESPMAGQMPPEMQDQVLHSMLQTGSFAIFASDILDTAGTTRGNQYALCLTCSSKSEINSLYAKLSAGGNITHPLKEEFFGTFGDCTDKFGIDWMFQLDPGMPE